MVGSRNKVELIGNCGRDPEVRTFPDGRKMVTFSMAMSEHWKDSNTGLRREKTEWCNVVVTNQGLIPVIEKYVKKGSYLFIEGALQTRKWKAQDGQEKYTTEVVVKPMKGEIIFLDKAPRTGGSEVPHAGPTERGSRPADFDLNDEIPL